MVVHEGHGLFLVGTQNGAFRSAEERPEMLIASGGEGFNENLVILFQTGRQYGVGVIILKFLYFCVPIIQLEFSMRPTSAPLMHGSIAKRRLRLHRKERQQRTSGWSNIFRSGIVTLTCMLIGLVMLIGLILLLGGDIETHPGENLLLAVMPQEVILPLQ